MPLAEKHLVRQSKLKMPACEQEIQEKWLLAPGVLGLPGRFCTGLQCSFPASGEWHLHPTRKGKGREQQVRRQLLTRIGELQVLLVGLRYFKYKGDQSWGVCSACGVWK